MISKSEIKQTASLAIKKFRDELGLFTVEGEKLVEEALASGFEIVKLWRTEEIGEDAMKRISSLSSPPPVLAVVRKPAGESSRASGADLGKSLSGLVLALDSVRDPGNLGTIIRLADWFGIRSIIASRDTVDIYNPKVVQATMGSIFRVSVSYCDLPEVLKATTLPVYGTFLEGSDIYTCELSPEGVLVMGSERDGISPEVEAQVNEKLFIPPFAAGQGARTSESLNVAIATAICCSEFRRRIF